MKRLTTIFMMILCLVSFTALAEDTPALFPIREHGLWGYMNRDGETVIEPKWMEARGFRGGYALVYPVPDEEDFCGIINTSGEWVIPPQHWEILETDNWGRYIGGRDEGIYIFSVLSFIRKRMMPASSIFQAVSGPGCGMSRWTGNGSEMWTGNSSVSR